ncbi:MAG: GNAT family N-acetyltransferase [Patescibacteria group bacterium]|nr:GNAT family N-acetyltransferase [Patescibacteria group bacterium]
MLKPGQIITNFKTKKGKEITIRVVDKNDAKKLMDFINPIFAEDTFLLRGPKDLVKNIKEQQKYVKDQLKKVRKKEGFLLLALYKNNIVGTTDLRKGQYRHKHMGDLGITVSKKFREEGIGQELLKILEQESKKLKLKALYLTCLACNLRAIHVYEKWGMKRVGILPRAYEYKGEFVDGITMWKEIS